MESATRTDIRVTPTEHEVLDNADVETHVVCCRSDWEVALCGVEISGGSPYDLIMDNLCATLVGIARNKLKALGVFKSGDGEPICFETGDPCLPEDYVWARIASRPD